MSTRNERVNDLFMEPLVGNPTEEGQVRNTGTDLVAFIGGSVKSLTSGSGSGDVIGPGSSTDNAVCRFDGATGKIIQDSNVTIDDAGNIGMPGGATVDGRDVSADGTKLDTIETGAQVNTVDSVNGQTGAVVLDAADVGAPPDSRVLTAGAGLTGGGDLTADRTFDVGANADGSIVVNANDVQVGVLATDAQHGNRGGGALHADATGAVSGFLSAADKTKLDGIEPGATADQTITAGAGLIGGGVGDVTLDVAANADGSIIVNTDDIQVGVLATDAQHGNRGGGSLHATATTSVAGFLSATDKTKLDQFTLTTPPVNVNKSAAQVGVSTDVARADHKHDIDVAAPVALEAGGANAQGSSSSLARADHVHRIEDPSTEVTASGTVTTTSTAFATIPGMTITPAAGTYLVWLNANGEHNNNSAQLVVGLAVDGADIAVTERTNGGTNQSDNQRITASTQAKVTVNGAQAIQGRWRREGGSGSIELQNRSLIILKVDG